MSNSREPSLWLLRKMLRDTERFTGPNSAAAVAIRQMIAKRLAQPPRANEQGVALVR